MQNTTQARRRAQTHRPTLPTRHYPELTFVPVPPARGSNRITINVLRASMPYGQIWTYREIGTRHHWHASLTAGGEPKAFADKESACRWMEETNR